MRYLINLTEQQKEILSWCYSYCLENEAIEVEDRDAISKALNYDYKEDLIERIGCIPIEMCLENGTGTKIIGVKDFITELESMIRTDYDPRHGAW